MWIQSCIKVCTINNVTYENFPVNLNQVLTYRWKRDVTSSGWYWEIIFKGSNKSKAVWTYTSESDMRKDLDYIEIKIFKQD